MNKPPTSRRPSADPSSPSAEATPPGSLDHSAEGTAPPADGAEPVELPRYTVENLEAWARELRAMPGTPAQLDASANAARLLTDTAAVLRSQRTARARAAVRSNIEAKRERSREQRQARRRRR